MAGSMEAMASIGLEDLPEACIAAILACTTPSDVARLACANRSFRDAAKSDVVWQKMLPPDYQEILTQVPDSPPTTSSRKKIYDFLCNGCFLHDGTQEIWLDKGSGGVCRSMGSRDLYICWGEDRRYWEFTIREGSRFPEIARLISVCWLEVRGRLQCRLPPGDYSLAWRVYVAEGSSVGWSYNPVTFSVEATSNEPVIMKQFLKLDGRRQRTNPFRNYRQLPYNVDATRDVTREGTRDAWMEIEVGEFSVKDGDLPLELKVAMTEIEGGNWKSGLCLDGVLIRPTFVLEAKRQQRIAKIIAD